MAVSMFVKAFFLLLAYLGACVAYSKGPPITTCETMSPLHFGRDRNRIEPQTKETNPYSITVSNSSYSPSDTLTVTIVGNAPHQFKGFILQARGTTSNAPVGAFLDPLPSHTQFLWCSSGEPQNTVGHKHVRTKPSWPSVALQWRAPSQSVGNVTFRATVVKQYDTFWTGVSSDIVMGTPAANVTAPALGSNFQINKVGCGVDKSCLSVPESCTNSEDCDFLVTYRVSGENITFEMSGKHGYVSFGFNEKPEMNNTDVIACATLPSSVVEVRHFYNDYHSPLRGPLTGYIFPEATVSENGITKCRVTRKNVAPGPSMRDLTKELYLIFARGKTGGTGSIQYHYGNRSWSAAKVDISVPQNISRQVALPTTAAPTNGDQISTSGCGSTKGCFVNPTGCTGSAACNYLVTYRADKGDIIFELSGKGAKWVGVGFNKINEMPNADMLVCAAVNGQVVVDHYYADNGKSDPTKTNPRPDSIKLETGEINGGTLTCSFRRKTNPRVNKMVDLNQTWYMLYGLGPITGDKIGIHTYRDVSSKRVNVNIASIIEGGKTPALVKIHGILMILSWMGCATIAIFMARYMRPAWPDTKLCDKNLWFVFHRSLMATCVLLTTAAFIIIFVHVKGWTKGDASSHAVIGVIVAAFMFIQPVMAFFRPHPGEPKRPLFNWAHRSVGLLAWVLSVVNMFLGLLLRQLGLKNTGLYIMIAFCVCVGVVLILEFYICCSTSDEAAEYSISGAKDGEMQMTHPDVKKMPTTSPQNLQIRQMFMVFVIIAVISLTIAALVIIGRA